MGKGPKKGDMVSGPETGASPYTNEEYTVGWVSALPIEMAAAKGMLDEEHGDPQTPPQEADHNTYLLGSMRGFKVVIACLPKDELGASSAAVVARDMLFTFPNIRVGLMVGIGAGIPHYDDNETRDIRLGDVVIGSDRGSSGVTVYDFGKRLPDGSFKNMYVLDRPPRPLRTALARMEAEHQTRESMICQYINCMLQKYPHMRKKGFAHPGSLYDRLFREDYRHGGGRSCAGCDPAQQIYREDRLDTSPEIHYGIVATGSAVVKHAPTREQIKRKHGAICLEMEAAGLINNFPCIVIRGISDYADSHKNDKWHAYAAATAAACAKELLGFVQATTLEAERKAKDVLQLLNKVSNEVSQISTHVTHINSAMDEGQKWKILTWLSPVDYGPQQSDHFSRRQEGTGEWLLDSGPFQQWLEQPKMTLFCQGIPGAGKTIMASLVNHLGSMVKGNGHTTLAYIFCNFRRQSEQTSADLLTSLLKQLAWQNPTLPECLRDLYGNHKSQQTRPTSHEIWTALRTICSGYEKVFVVVDALDECQVSERGRAKFLAELFRLQDAAPVNVFATSRFIEDIKGIFEQRRALFLEIRAHDSDIEKYLEGHMSSLPSFISRELGLANEVKTRIVEAVDGMFLLAKLHLDSLQDKISNSDVRNALKDLPKGQDAYERAYSEAKGRIQGQMDGLRNLAMRVLSWIVCTKRPIKTSELQHAIAVKGDARELDRDNITDLGLMTSVCAGLVTVDKSSNIVRLVHYTAQEYFEQQWTSWFPDANTDIALTCITYLSFDTFASGICKTDSDFEKRLLLYPLYDFAAVFWAHHFGSSRVDIETSIMNLLEDGFKSSAVCQAMLVSGSSRHLNYSRMVPNGVSGLHLAAHLGLVDITRSLMNRGCRADSKDSHGRTPLSWAAAAGHAEVVKLLLSCKATEADLKDYQERTPLGWAALGGHKDTVQLLLSRDDVDPMTRNLHGQTPLTWAARNGHYDVVDLLLNAGADPDTEDKFNRRPLWWTVRNGHHNTARLLLEAGADPDLDESNGQTLFSRALRTKHKEVIVMLQERGLHLHDSWRYGQTALSRAAETCNQARISLLLRKGHNPDTKDADGRTPLSWAAQSGSISAIRLLLCTGATPTLEDTSGGTPLLWAIKNCQFAAARHLLDYGVDHADNDGRTPLSWAAETGGSGLVNDLLDQGARLDSKDNSGLTPLLQAVKNEQISVMSCLLDRGSDPNSSDDQGRICLLWAVRNRNDEAVLLLLQRGANPNCTDKHGRTPLFLAAMYGEEKAVRFLLDHGAQPNVTDNVGQSPLFFAASAGNHAVIALLLENEANANQKDNLSQTPLMYIIRCGQEDDAASALTVDADSNSEDVSTQSPRRCAMAHGQETVVRLLLANGADPNVKDYSNDSPLLCAVSNRQENMVRLLLAHGADPNAKDGINHSPLLSAVNSRQDNMVRLLLANGADPNIKGYINDLPLRWAVRDGQESMVRLLLAHGADPNAKDGINHSPLLWAVNSGQDNIVRLLLANGADPNIKGYMNDLPLLCAVSNRQENMVRLLLAHGADPNTKDGINHSPLLWAVNSGQDNMVRLLLPHGADPDTTDKISQTALR